jgi:hypothetical protein
MTMIQAIVTRLATNSFQMKGWAVVLVSGLFALAAASTDRRLALVAYVPTIGFWALDAYYLRQERLFRCLYDSVRDKTEDEVDYSMDTQPFSGKVVPAWQVAGSKTLLWFYGPLLGTVVVASIKVA